MTGLRPLAAASLAALALAGAALAQSAPVKVGALTIDAPWMRATPGGAQVAGGYLRVTNGGPEPDRLVAASIPLAARGEVHEMSVEGGVMRMRPVEGGIVIPPGGTVELKPGGYHLMFMDLSAALEQGETVETRLTFERAGSVTIPFPVGSLGARGPEAATRADR